MLYQLYRSHCHTCKRLLHTTHKKYPTVTAFHHTDTPGTPQQLDTLKQFIQSAKHLTVITGAGISTESGISDYRSPGRPAHKPMQHQQFMSYDIQRRRYWARSYVGYMSVWQSKPNLGHYALAYAQQCNTVQHIITQNVDGLHQAAGATNVTELHGSIHHVICTQCHTLYDRQVMQQWLTELNPHFHSILHNTVNNNTDVSGTKDIELAQRALERLTTANEQQRPDGDMELGGTNDIYQSFNYPACPSCNGILKANVVFFGANVPKYTAVQCDEIIQHSDAILVVGSSLAVWSAYRLVRTGILRNPVLRTRLPVISAEEQQRIATQRCCNVGIVNDGPTRADALVDIRLHGRTGQILPWLFDLPMEDTGHQQQYMDLNRMNQEAPL